MSLQVNLLQRYAFSPPGGVEDSEGTALAAIKGDDPGRKRWPRGKDPPHPPVEGDASMIARTLIGVNQS